MLTKWWNDGLELTAIVITIGEDGLGCVTTLCEPDSGPPAEPTGARFPWLKADTMLEDRLTPLRIMVAARPGGDKGISNDTMSLGRWLRQSRAAYATRKYKLDLLRTQLAVLEFFQNRGAALINLNIT